MHCKHTIRRPWIYRCCGRRLARAHASTFIRLLSLLYYSFRHSHFFRSFFFYFFFFIKTNIIVTTINSNMRNDLLYTCYRPANKTSKRESLISSAGYFFFFFKYRYSRPEDCFFLLVLKCDWASILYALLFCFVIV